jgi:dienelactone hydrolase
MTFSGPPPLPLPDRWVPLRWKVAQRLTPQQIDRMLRLDPHRALRGVRPRLAALGLPEDVSRSAIGRIRSLAEWSDSWTLAAAQALTQSREQAALGRLDAAAVAQRHAAMAYHVATWQPGDDARAIRAMRANSAALFARAMAELDPGSTRVDVPWRAGSAPGYLARPPAIDRDVPLVVLLNGMTTAKEELILWAEPFLWRGLAVLALDWPGSGESALTCSPDPDCAGLSGLIRLALDEQGGIDTRRMGLLGVSLGGALAVRMAARDPGIAAVVAVTPPFDARRWLHRASPVLQRHFAVHAGSVDEVEGYAAGFALGDVAPALRAPLLVLGAGADMMVPPGEAISLAAAAPKVSTLSWHPGAGHALFDRIPAWTTEAAEWLAGRLE